MQMQLMSPSLSTTCSENYDPGFPDQPVVDLYLPIWASQPAFKSKPAFVWADDDNHGNIARLTSSITYSQLNSSVQTIATNLMNLLSSLDLQRGDTLLILTSPGLHLVKILFACQRAGLVAVPIIPPPTLNSDKKTQAYYHLLRVLLQTNPKAAIAHHHYIASTVSPALTTNSQSGVDHRLYKLINSLCWLSVEKLLLDTTTTETSIISTGRSNHNHNNYSSDDDHELYQGCKSDEQYLVQYTSGATGIPKPVTVTAGAAAHNVRAARKAYDLQPSSIIVSWLPQYHDCGLMFLLLTVVSGATCVLTSPAAFLARPRLWLELISEFKATCTPVPSFALPLVAKRPGGINKLGPRLPLNLGSLRNLILINEPIYKSCVQEFVNEFVHVGLNPSCISPSYGLAENCTFVSTAWSSKTCTAGRYFSADMPAYKKLLPCARLAYNDCDNIKIVVVDEETCEPVEDGEEGEIWISSASNASGYLHHPSLTREVFHGRLRSGTTTGHCYLRTGDRGVIINYKGEAEERRYLYVIGRAHDIINMISMSVCIHPHYLETAAYKSKYSSYLRGGCIAAIEVGERVVMVVAELQKNNHRPLTSSMTCSYRSVCEGIREEVTREEGITIGVVMLVETGLLPKTTSGKLRRFLAKDMLLKGRFPVVYQLHFQELITSSPLTDHIKGDLGRTDQTPDTDDNQLQLVSFANSYSPILLRSFL